MTSKKFSDFPKSAQYITPLGTQAYFPDYLPESRQYYKAYIDRFNELLISETSSENLYKKIQKGKDSKTRIQLLRIFRKYISPVTSVEMLKTKKNTNQICNDFGDTFRPIDEVRELVQSEDVDVTLSALLWEYKDRGSSGYELTDLFFTSFEDLLGDDFEIIGPRREGKDVDLSQVLDAWSEKTPADFVIRDKSTEEILVIGFARYDQDRGGAQEDDRISGNAAKILRLISYNESNEGRLKCLFVNDGPGLLLGSMWDDYKSLEEEGGDYVRVATLKMINDIVTSEWILADPSNTIL